MKPRTAQGGAVAARRGALRRRAYPREKMATLPNILSCLRIAATPVMVLLLLMPGASLTAPFVVFAAASVTDYLDGILARRHNQVTSLGKLLDPLADKLLTSAVLIMLIPFGKVTPWFVFVIVGRELAVTGLRSIAASRGLIIKAGSVGKGKLVCQTVGILLLLLDPGVAREQLDMAGLAFLWLSVGLAYWSGADYALRFYREIRGSGDAGGRV